ncbi:hypothetical protein AB0H92_43940, partial [Streptomyces phaeochromogenes]|uniref:hypothetical protein n=1 Tax=Streptomyces phaeochromogenes TaxID=1923 RepID=UPI0033C0359B
ETYERCRRVLGEDHELTWSAAAQSRTGGAGRRRTFLGGGVRMPPLTRAVVGSRSPGEGR